MKTIPLAVLMIFGLIGVQPVQGARLTLLCGAVEAWPTASCRAAAARFEQISHHQVRIIEAPPSAEETLTLLLELFAVESDALDVVQMDIVWPGILERHLDDLGARGHQLAAEQVEAAGKAGVVGERVLALPLNVDVGMLFYRRDLLEAHDEPVPRVWPELRSSAGRIAGAAREAGRTLDGFLFQGRAYEGLTCNALEWMAASGAPSVVAHGRIAVDQPEFKAILAAAASWIGETAPRWNLEATEPETLTRFGDGRSIFMRHWVSAAGQLARQAPEIFDVTGVGPLPTAGKGPSTGTLGGWMIGISAYSSEPEAARDLVAFLASAEEQRRRGLEDGLMPAARSLQEDPELLEALPGLSAASGLLEDAIVRPAKDLGPGYLAFSREFANAVHAVLTGDDDADEALDALQRRLERLSGGGQRWSQ